MKLILKIQIIIIFLFGCTGYSQQYKNQKISKSFEIEKGIVNGNDLSEFLSEKHARIVFYKESKNSDLMMANFWQKDNSQSFGKAKIIKHEHEVINDEVFESDTYFIKWKFKNTYNDKKGVAKIKLKIHYTTKGNYVQITIIPKDCEVLIYKGYEVDNTGIARLLKKEL